MVREPILIVDDSPANLKLARVVLQAAGYEVRVATDADQALRVLETWHPGLILMDIQLPGMDGLTLTRRLKDTSETKDIVVIALTAYAMKGDEERARAAGCDGYVSKPIDTEALPRIVAEHLARAVPHPAEREPPLILVVDDNATTRKVLRLTLEGEGYRVVEAANATLALAWLAQGMPALALVDLVLPDFDGAELVHRLRALPGGADLPVVAVSGFLRLAADTRMPLGEFDAVVAKPVEPHRLVEIVRGYLPRDGGAAPRPGHGKHVLVVDDDPAQLKLTAVHLRHAGFRVCTAESGDAALEQARANPPDLIVSDVLMPGLDGFGLCVAVRADPRLARIPVVLASAYYREAADDELARRVGANVLVGRSADVRAIVAAAEAQLGAAPPPPSSEPRVTVSEAHRTRIVQQLERQAVANETLLRRCTLQAAQLSILGGTADALARSGDVEHVIDDTLAACLDAGGISRGALYRRGANGQLFLCRTVGFSDGERLRLESDPGHAHLLEQVMASGMAVTLGASGCGGEADPPLPCLRLGSAVILPLLAQHQRVGALLLGADVPEVTGPDLLDFGRAVAAYLGQAIALAGAFEREQQARREAERASRAKDEFLGVLSHELRTPLAAIVGWTALLRTRASDAAWLDRAITTIQRNARAQVQLIEDLLDVTRINSGALRLEPEQMDAASAIHAVLEAVAPMADAKGVRVEAELEPGAGALWGDPSRVQQIVWNLVANGVKFTPAGGEVKVRLARRDGGVQIQVSDTGQGIAKDFLPHVFERFVQANGSPTRTHGGLGLGLWIVSHLVRLHGGEVRAESDGEGRGATMTVTLPDRAASGASVAVAAPRA